MQNVKIHIENDAVKRTINACIELVEQLNYPVQNIVFDEKRSNTLFGEFCMPENPLSGDAGTITLNPDIYDNDTELKSTIYHELAHYIDFWIQLSVSSINYNCKTHKYYRGEGYSTPHGYIWKEITKRITKQTGIRIERLGSKCLIEETNVQNAKYIFQCVNCGNKIYYYRNSKFVQTYDKKNDKGNPIWVCSLCDGAFKKIKG